MTIQALAVNVGGTNSVTGGTSTSVLSKGSTLSKRSVILDDSSEYIDQTRIEFSAQDPRVSTGAPNGYTQARSSFVMEVPLLLDNGKRTINTLTCKIAVDPETTDAEIAEMLSQGAQMLYSSALLNFWQKQSTD